MAWRGVAGPSNVLAPVVWSVVGDIILKSELGDGFSINSVYYKSKGINGIGSLANISKPADVHTVQ